MLFIFEVTDYCRTLNQNKGWVNTKAWSRGILSDLINGGIIRVVLGLCHRAIFWMPDWDLTI